MKEEVKVDMAASASMEMSARVSFGVRAPVTIWDVQHYDKNGNLIYEEYGNRNIVVDQGLNDILSKYFVTGAAAYTPDWYVGLVDNSGFSGFSGGDAASGIGTTATAANGWEEFSGFSGGARKAFVPGTVASQSVDNSASKASFAISAAGTVHGAFLIFTNGLASGVGVASGILYGEAAFAADRTVATGDTLNVTVTLTSATG